MTPSNANTSGLEVVAWRVWSVEGEGGLYYHQDIAADNAGETSFVEPLVTAASAQAEREQYGRWLVAAANACDAAEARADRLAKACTVAMKTLSQIATRSSANIDQAIDNLSRARNEAVIEAAAISGALQQEG